MKQTIESVAKGLGWDCREDYGVLEVAIPSMGGFHTSIKPECNLVYIAAYAKAEMAKRGWTPFAEGTTVGYSIQFFDEYGEQANGDGQTTACHDYDPREPIAEANATLLAIAEALTLPPNAPFSQPAT